jgi:hypothetical protein
MNKNKENTMEPLPNDLNENPSLDRWMWLLKRTVMDNNWNALHESFQTDNSYFRELADTLDYVNDEANSVHPNHLVRQSINGAIGVFKVFREVFALDMLKKHTATPYDANLFISMFNRTVAFEENDQALLDAVKDSFNKRRSDEFPLVNTLDQAFQISRVEGRPPNPYKVPNNVKMLLAMIIDGDMSKAKAIERIDSMANNHSLKSQENKGLWRTANDQPRPQIWGEDRWKDEMRIYKWAALNDYLYKRVAEGRTSLTKDESKRIHKHWNEIDIPKELEIYPTFIKVGIGRLIGKDSAKTITADVIKTKH